MTWVFDWMAHIYCTCICIHTYLVSGFAAHVKQNYASVKQSAGPSTPHREVMRLLSASYKQASATRSRIPNVIQDQEDIEFDETVRILAQVALE